jgi:opacity protein-like surface antigen
MVVPPPIQTVTNETNVSGTIRGRFGYVQGRVLLYSTAGIAWAQLHAKIQNQDAAQQALAGDDRLGYSDTHWHFGFALGNGIEWAVHDNLTLKAEYLFIYPTKSSISTPRRNKDFSVGRLTHFGSGSIGCCTKLAAFLITAALGWHWKPS